jgi:NAD(P)-dependent dehydrogenase (short-subunit alcohol dehydrogenase family)
MSVSDVTDRTSPQQDETSEEPTVRQLFDLTGRVAVVTGGCGHLGSAMCRALAEAGANVVVTSRQSEKAQAFAAALPTITPDQQHQGLRLDHSTGAGVDSLLQQLDSRYGRVDVLVNNAHTSLGKDWSTVTADEFRQQLDQATSYFLLARGVRDLAVTRQRPASIVLLGSMYGLVGSYPDVYSGVCSASPVAYQVLKGGLVQMARHLAVYWAGDGVRVNCLSPGPFPAETAVPELQTRLASKVPLQRIGRPCELKGAVLFLASDASSYVTGQNLIVDGGWTAW